MITAACGYCGKKAVGYFNMIPLCAFDWNVKKKSLKKKIDFKEMRKEMIEFEKGIHKRE